MNEKMNRELDGIPAEKLDSLLSGVSEVKASDDLPADRAPCAAEAGLPVLQTAAARTDSTDNRHLKAHSLSAG